MNSVWIRVVVPADSVTAMENKVAAVRALHDLSGNDIRVVTESTLESRSLDGRTWECILSFVVTVGSNIALGVAGNFVYDLLKALRAQRASVNGKRVSLEREDVVSAVHTERAHDEPQAPS